DLQRRGDRPQPGPAVAVDDRADAAVQHAQHVAARAAGPGGHPPGRALRLGDGRGPGRPARRRLRSRGMTALRALSPVPRRRLLVLALAAAAAFFVLALLVQL